jgi:hypothetical protein
MSKSDLEIIREAYDKVGIGYVVRVRGEWSYLFPVGTYNKEEVTLGDLDHLLTYRKFMDFKDGTLSSY